MSTERTWDDLVELNERQEYGQAWLPDREDDHPGTLVGTVCGYDQGPMSEYTGERPWVCTIQDRHGKLWSVWLNRAVLVSEFEKHRPLPDERVVLRYRGRQQDTPSRAGAAPAHLYTVTVDRDQQLPAFLTRPQLEPGQDRRRDLEVTGGSDVPDDTAGFAYGQPPAAKADAEVTDAQIVEDKPDSKGADDDDPIPF
jgi:hypothetical protein